MTEGPMERGGGGRSKLKTKCDRKSGKEKLGKEKENINFLEIKIEFVVHKKKFPITI